ncbi:MAG: LysM peptidoglycan-binding domain-containing protein [Rhodospirillales bacterium]
MTVGLVLAIARWPKEEAPPPIITSPSPAPAAPAPADAGVSPPSFDVARISREGDTVIAGRAAPGSTVAILGNGTPLGTVTADSQGQWVFVPEAPLPPGAHRLTLSMQRASQPTVAGNGEVLVIVPEAGKDIAGRAAEAASRPLALLVPATGDGAPVVLQRPGDDVAAGVVIDLVDYGSDGRLTVAGRARAKAEIRILLDGRPLASATADAAGSWSARKQVPLAGNHVLEAQELDARGKVAGRFVGRLRLAPPATVAPSGEVPGGSIVIEPGQNLWRIARRTYGQGYAYTVIFGANRGRIDDPDLIYPGQVLVLPPTPAASGN